MADGHDDAGTLPVPYLIRLALPTAARHAPGASGQNASTLPGRIRSVGSEDAAFGELPWLGW